MNTDMARDLEQLRGELQQAQGAYERSRTETEKRKADVDKLEWGITLLAKYCQNGKPEGKAASGAKGGKVVEDQPVMRLQDAARESMKALGQFTERSLEEQIHTLYPSLEFATKSLRKPLIKARDEGFIRKLRPNEGNKSQALWEWIGK